MSTAPETRLPKPNILAFLASYLPGFKAGGPVRSMGNLVTALSDEFEFRIITADRDLGDSRPYAIAEAASGAWVNLEPASMVRYLHPSDQTPRAIAQLLRATPHDLLYLNSFFSVQFTFFPLLVRRLGLVRRRGPVLLAPRGEFSRGALSLKPSRKRIYILIMKWAGLLAGVHWHASSESEANDIRQAIRGNNPIHVARNLSTAPPQAIASATRPDSHTLRLLFLSRISPMKNLDFALETLAKCKLPVQFSIYGPIGDHEYWSACQAIMDRLPTSVTVSYHGPVAAADVAGVMAKHDLFFLPSRGENYGHVIAEAIAVGTPVLISNTTPWRGLQRIGIGYDIELGDQGAFIDVIERFSKMSASERQERRVATHAAAKGLWQANQDLQANRDMLSQVMDAGRGKRLGRDHE